MIDISSKQSEIKEFFATLNLVHTSPMGGVKELRDIGLVIIDSTEPFEAESITRYMDGDYIFFRLNDSYYSRDFCDYLLEANDKGLPYIVDLQCDLSPQALQILHQLSEDNRFTIEVDKALKSVELNPDASVIVVVTREVLEEKITHPYFQSLFGPILTLS